MKVLLVSHRFPPDSITGVERYTQSLARELVRNGDSVAVLARRPDPTLMSLRLLRERLPDSSILYRVIGGTGGPARFLAHDKESAELFALALIETEADVVHINHLLDMSPRVIEIAHRHGVPVVVSLHDFYFACPLVHLRKQSGDICTGADGGLECARTCFAHEGDGAVVRWGLRAAYFRQLLASADRIISPSQYVAKFFEQTGIPSSRIRVIPNGTLVESADAGHSLGVARLDDGLRVVFLGAVVPHKGPHIILEALELARLGRVDLLLLGPTPDMEYADGLVQRAEEIPGLRLVLHGPYAPVDLPWLLRDVDCAVTPSQVAETFSMTTREVTAFGVPVIVSRLGALPEAVKEGENGFTFDHQCPSELAFILRRLTTNKLLLQNLRDGARRLPVVTMPQHMNGVRTVYDELLQDDDLCRRRAGSNFECDTLYSCLLALDFGAAASTATSIVQRA
jgi:glycosyltransferase involved in cell wall biosynthesis